jgi:hypothetical protein
MSLSFEGDSGKKAVLFASIRSMWRSFGRKFTARGWPDDT